MNEYVAMWKNFANFHDRTTVRGYWMAFLINFLVSFVIGLVVGIIPALEFVSTIYSIAVLIPSLAIAVRRFNDCGHSWKSLLWYLLPLVGWVIVIIRLCKKSAAEPEVV